MFQNVTAMLTLAAVTAPSLEAEEKAMQALHQQIALQDILSK